MISKLRLTFLLLLLPALSLVAACGGSDDSSDDSDDDSGGSGFGPGGSGNAKATSSGGSGSQKSKSAGVVKGVKDGAFQKGSVTVEISGDKRSNTTLEGGGIAQSGLVLLNFASNDSSVFLTFVAEEGDEQGGLAITYKDMATAGAWGETCEATVNVQDAKLSGDFKCDKIDAISPGEAKAFRINVKGKFSVER